jgi:hypothetical protein
MPFLGVKTVLAVNLGVGFPLIILTMEKLAATA